MKKLFLVAVDDDATKDQRDAFTAYLRAAKCGFWHHIAAAWVIQESGGSMSAGSLRDKLMEIMPGVSSLVMQVKPMDYAAYAPQPSHQWLIDYVKSSKWP